MPVNNPQNELTTSQHNTCLINIANLESTRYQHALQAKDMHNKYISGHNHKPPFLVQSSKLISKNKGNCVSANIFPSLSLDLMVSINYYLTV